MAQHSFQLFRHPRIRRAPSAAGALLHATLGTGTAATADGKDKPKAAETTTPDISPKAYDAAVALCDAGKHPEAEKALRSLVDARRDALGAEAPETLRARMMLMAMELARHTDAAAEARSSSLLLTLQRVLGREHRDTLHFQRHAIYAKSALGRFDEAEQEFRSLIRTDERVLGPEDPETLRCCYNLAVRLGMQEKHQEALTYAQRAYAGDLMRLGKDHPDTQKSEQLVRVLTRLIENV